jgi:hypothetical protein
MHHDHLPRDKSVMRRYREPALQPVWALCRASARTFSEPIRNASPATGVRRFEEFDPLALLGLAPRSSELDRPPCLSRVALQGPAPTHFVGTDFGIVGKDGRFECITGFVDVGPGAPSQS